jgi:hypothetical protein
LPTNSPGRILRKNKGAIGENLDRLEWFGLAIDISVGITHWQYAELQQTA